MEQLGCSPAYTSLGRQIRRPTVNLKQGRYETNSLRYRFIATAWLHVSFAGIVSSGGTCD